MQTQCNKSSRLPRCFLFVYLLTFAVATAPASSARADSSGGGSGAGSVKDAQAGLSKAYNDYYEALRKSPSPSQEEASRLSQQILAPAEAKLGISIGAQTTRIFHDPVGARPQFGSAILGPLPSGFDLRKKPSGTSRPTALSAPVQAVASPAVSPSQPETVLDGSGVPKEIEFPGVKADQ